MESTTNAQQLFFQHVKGILPAHLSLVDEIAGLLRISNDSAYRRIRGEKEISFEELRTLCSHFKISLDQLFHLETDTVLFEGKFVNHEHFDLESYLRGLLQLLQYTRSFHQCEILCMAKDIPIFHHFNFPELAAFKAFFWMKTILQYPQYLKKRLVLAEMAPSTIQLCSKLIEAYNKVPTQEIWNIEGIHATIQQVEYYRETKVFASDKDLETVYDCLLKTVDHVEAQVEQGSKSAIGSKEPGPGAPLKFYINEFLIGDNTYLVHLDDSRMVVLNHSMLNTIQTRDTNFARHTEEHFQNIIRRSTQISGVGEKERNKFFNAWREMIEASRKR
jgi:hypothetical protein